MSYFWVSCSKVVILRKSLLGLLIPAFWNDTELMKLSVLLFAYFFGI